MARISTLSRFRPLSLALLLGGAVAAFSAPGASAQGVPEMPFANMPHLKALADRLQPITLRDPQELPYVYSTVLPPRRPTNADIIAERNRQRLRDEAQRPVLAPVAVAPRPATNGRPLCASSRCPHANMIGIQY